MKKYAVIFAVVLSFLLLAKARGQALFFSSGLPPYSCASSVAGFNLTAQGEGYRLTGALYVPLPGYSASISAVSFPPNQPQDPVATLTLIPPSNIINRYALPRLAVVPPLLIDYSFPSAVPVHKLTVYIVNPVNRFDTQITCLLTGATQ